MKVNLEFELPEEEHDLKLAIDGYKWALAFSDVYEQLRRYQRGKADLPENVKNKDDLLEYVTNLCLTMVDDYNLNFNDIY